MDKLSPELLITILLTITGVIGYLFIQQGKHRDRILAVEILQQTITDKITAGFKDVKDEIAKVNIRFDTFMKNEIDLLKDLITKEHNNGK